MNSRFLVLPGSLLIFTEITRYKYFSLIWPRRELIDKREKNIVPPDPIIGLISFLWYTIFTFYYTRVTVWFLQSWAVFCSWERRTSGIESWLAHGIVRSFVLMEIFGDRTRNRTLSGVCFATHFKKSVTCDLWPQNWRPGPWIFLHSWKRRRNARDRSHRDWRLFGLQPASRIISEMSAQVGQSDREESKLRRTIHRKASMHSVSGAPHQSRATDRKETGFARAGSLESRPKSLLAGHRLRDHRSFETLAGTGSKSCTVQSRSGKYDHKEDSIGFARAGSFESRPKSPLVGHRLFDHRSFETPAGNGSKSFTVQSRSGKYDRQSIESSLKREIQQCTSLDRSSPTRRPTSNPQYSAPGSTRQLATFCEEERVRFLSAKSAKLEEPLKWIATAQPVPQRSLGLSMLFAMGFSLIFRLWSAIVLFCRKQPARLDTTLVSAGTIPSVPPTTLLPFADSSTNSTLIQKYLVRMDEFSTQASSAMPRQSDYSRSQTDTREAILSTPQYPRSCFEASEQVSTRAVSAGTIPSSTNCEPCRNGNTVFDENQPHLSSRTSKKPIVQGVNYRHRAKPQGGSKDVNLARGRAQSSESIFVHKTADASAWTSSP